MKILYLSYLTEDSIFNQIAATGLEPSVARHKFETAFMRALLKNESIHPENVELISCAPYNAKLTQRPEQGEWEGKKITYIWWNIKDGSLLSAIRQVRRLTADWYERTDGQERVIVTYATNPAIFLPKRKRKCPLITICSEIPRFRDMPPNLESIIKKEYYHYLNEQMDGYIYFTKHMSEACNRKGKPSVVVEGMPDIMQQMCVQKPFANKTEQIFYAGGLNAKNGILELLEAFCMLDRKDIYLTLCGVGDVLEQVKVYAQKYDNIFYRGSIPNTEILALEQEATLLINPRKADYKLTRYSFPSKTFEYFCSGTPCVMTKLDGIPEEYYQYCYTCDSSSADVLCQDLKQILEIPQEERHKKAQEAMEFILREKTAEKQTEQIVRFLQNVCNTHKG